MDGRRALHEYVAPLAPFLAALDFLIVIVAGLGTAPLVSLIRIDTAIWPPHPYVVMTILVAAIVTPTILSWFGAYRPWRGISLWPEIQLILAAWLIVVIGFALYAVATKTAQWYSRAWLGCWISTTFISLSVGRVVLRLTLRKLRARGYDTKRIILVGSGPLARKVVNDLRHSPWAGFMVTGYFSAGEAHVGGIGVACLGGLLDLKNYVEQQRAQIDQVWVVIPLTEENVLRKSLELLSGSTVDIRLVPDMFAYQLLNYSVEEVAGIPLLNISYSPFSGPVRYLKEATDKVVALGVVLLTAPILAAIALGIRLSSPGPIVFRQLRHGWDGRAFTVYKFRTMRVEGGGFRQAIRNDPRVTKFGAFLRRTSLDELPQFFNVLQGTMSVVGPRPHPVEMNNALGHKVDRYMLRHKVKPGITGWAQINGFRGETDTLEKLRKRVEYDLYYIEHWSFWFDIKIILLTVLRGFRQPTAY